MNLVICLGGGARWYESTNFISNIIEPIKKSNKFNIIDIFFCTYDVRCNIKDRTLVNIPNLVDTYKPKNHIVLNHGDYFAALPEHYRRNPAVATLYTAWDCKRKAFNLMSSYAKENNIQYDVCIVTRFDFLFTNEININELLDTSAVYFTRNDNCYNSLLMPDFWWHGSPDKISTFMDLNDHYSVYYPTNDATSPEKVLIKHLVDKTNFNIKFSNLTFNYQRQGTTEGICQQRPPVEYSQKYKELSLRFI